jgi:hypothetical protein
VARLFHASFDTTTPTQLQQLGLWSLVGAGIVSTTGRTGNGVTGTAGASQADNTLRTRQLGPATGAIGYQGFALKCTSLPAAERKVWALLDNAGTVLLTLTIRTDGKVRLFRGTFESGTAIATSATAFVASGAFRYLQVGYNLVVADNAQVRSTVSGGATSLLIAPTVGLSSPLPWSRAEFYLDESLILDDYYVNDAGGMDPRYFDGDVSIVVLRPDTVYDHSYFGFFPWTPNSGSDLAAPVDDAAPDGDSTFIFTRTDFATLRYVMDALADDGRRIDDVLAVFVARATSSAWAAGVSHAWRRYDGIDLFGTGMAATTSYSALTYMVKAQGGLGGNIPWTFAHLNASRFGVIG